MNQILLFLHFVGLMLGAAGGFTSGLLMRKALTMPDDQAKVVRGLGPLLANVMAAGVTLLWVTGPIMVWTRWDGFSNLPSMFWVKAIFIVTLTVAAILILKTYRDIKAGNPAAAARLPKLGPVAGISALLAVLFAVISFS